MPPRNTFAATRRSHQILDWLQAGEDVTIQRICEEFDLQYPQARADLKLLEELYSLSTYRDGRTKVWKWSRVSPHITFATAAALEFGGIAMDIFQGTPYGEEIDRITAYCRERVGRAQEGRLDRLSSALHLRRTWMPEDQEQMIDHVEIILDAFQLNKPIEIVYERAHDGKKRTYKVHPRSIIWYNGRLWLLARHQEQDKHFDIVGIERVRILRKETVDELEELDLQEHFKNAFGIFAGKDFPVEAIRLIVDGSWASYFKRYRLHPSQELRELGQDDKIEVSLHMAICPEFKSFLKSMVPAVQVVEPAELRDELYDQIRRWLNETAHRAAEEARQQVTTSSPEAPAPDPVASAAEAEALEAS